MKVYESYDIPRYFFSQITCFCSVWFNCNVLFAFHNFVSRQTKFFCLLLYCFASRQHQQIFCHHQTKGDFSNIADTYFFKFVDLNVGWAEFYKTYTVLPFKDILPNAFWHFKTFYWLASVFQRFYQLANVFQRHFNKCLLTL